MHSAQNKKRHQLRMTASRHRQAPAALSGLFERPIQVGLTSIYRPSFIAQTCLYRDTAVSFDRSLTRHSPS